MEKLSFLEKLGILGQNILAHPFFICILLLPVVLIFLNKKITKKTIVLAYFGILLVVLFVGNTTIFSLFDNVVDTIFMALYFPNFATLFIVEVVSAIIMLVTFIKKEISKSKKIINIVSFIIIQTIFCLVLTVIQVNDINIYEENALYGNSDVLTLMQLLMGTFAIQIITLLVIYIIDKITYRLDVKEGKVAHITHAKVKPEIVIEYKEPEVKLPKSKPVKPLNKKLIEKSKIEPISLNEMINKEIIQEKLLKPEPELPKVQAEALYIPKKEKVVPTIPKVKTETLNVDKPTKKPDLLKPEVIKEVPKQKVKWVPGPRPEVTTKVTKEKGPLTFTEFKPEFPDSEIKKTSMAPTINENPSIIKEVMRKKEPIKQEVKENQAVKPKKPEELIVNLVIVNLGKTVSAIKSLDTVYTM